MLSALSVWQNSLDEIKRSMTPLSYNTWVATMTPICIKDNTLVLQVKDPSTKNTLKSIYTQTLTDCINRANSGTYLVRFIDESELPLYNAYREDKPVAGSDYYLNPKYTFESFVVGNSNIFAHAAAQAVAEEPGKAYNPLFIYGGVGLGKTHLMHAIGHRILNNNPSARIVYITTETFTNDLIQSIQENSRVQFRNKYRNVDVLMIDDVQFIAGKNTTQEEFFNTFNTLHTSGKQIIISSDKAPKDLINLEDRLVSRFEGGLVADIQPPDLETRVAILKRKAQSEQIDVSEDVLTFIAEKVNSNIRQLEGSLIRVIAFARLTKKPIDLALTATALKDIVAGYDNTPVTIPLVQQQLSRAERILIEYVALVVWAYMHPHQQHFAVLHLRIAVLQVHLARAHAFNLGPYQGYTAFICVLYKIIVPGAAVFRHLPCALGYRHASAPPLYMV